LDLPLLKSRSCQREWDWERQSETMKSGETVTINFFSHRLAPLRGRGKTLKKGGGRYRLGTVLQFCRKKVNRGGGRNFDKGPSPKGGII